MTGIPQDIADTPKEYLNGFQSIPSALSDYRKRRKFEIDGESNQKNLLKQKTVGGTIEETIETCVILHDETVNTTTYKLAIPQIVTMMNG
jgi:hypothetical protein